MPTPKRPPLGAVLVVVLVGACLLFSPGEAAAQVADLSIVKMDDSFAVTAGFYIVYTIWVSNAGPDAAADVSWSDTLPAPTTFMSLDAPAGWSCITPPVDSGGAVSCSIASLPPGSATFKLVAGVPADTPAGTVISNTATAGSTTSDPDGGDLSATETTSVKKEANISAEKVGTPDPVTPGTDLTYTITVHNGGPSFGTNVTMSDVIPNQTTFVSFASPAGWSCVTPAVGAGGTVACSIASLPLGDFVFTLVVHVRSDFFGFNVENRGLVAPSDIPLGGMFEALTSVGSPIADISLTKSDSPDPVSPGGNITYTLTANNAGPSSPFVTLDDTLPAGTTFVSLSSPADWSCVTPNVGASGTVTCTRGAFGVGSADFTLVVQVDPSTAAGTVISNSASLTMPAAVSDPNPGDTNPTAETTVASAANVNGIKSASGTFQPGTNVTYSVLLSNNGPGAQGDNPGDEFVDVLPAGLTLVDAIATSGTAAANVGTNTVTWNGSIAAGGSVIITITATITAALGTPISNQGTVSFDADGDGTNETSRSTDDPAGSGSDDPTVFVVGAQITDVPVLDWRGLVALVALLAALGVGWLRRG
jgi:uncharacterized repeat protein (TIGR01451 family)